MNIFKRLYRYKDLLLVFVWREFAVRYRQSVLGVLWTVVQPLSMMALFLFIFSFVMRQKVSDYPAWQFFFGGILPWQFFSASLNYSVPTLEGNYQLITKIYFPREILPLSGILVAFLDYLVASAFFAVLLLFFGVRLTWNVLWFLPLLVLLFVFTVSISLLLSGLNVYYRDVRLATGFIIQLWFFASPVMYSIDSLDIKIKVFLFINPLTFIIENMRRCVFEGRGVVPWQFALVSLIIILFYSVSYRTFTKIERAFADVI